MSASAMSKPRSDEYAHDYEKYVSLVAEEDILAALDRQVEETLAVLKSIPEDRADFRYAEGKWSIKELIGHIIDSERVFAYRALRFARNDQTPLAGFEQDDYARNDSLSKCSLSDLAEEFEHVRKANLLFFRRLDDQAWARRGAGSGNEFTVRALAYIILGHERHHLSVLRARYV
jgi:uncharacterized damage-inducible protein DinB